MPKRLRQALYRRLTQLSYICNQDVDRAAFLRVRNQVMNDTYSDTNRSDNEKKPVLSKPFDSIPDAMKNEDAK